MSPPELRSNTLNTDANAHICMIIKSVTYIINTAYKCNSNRCAM